MVLAPTRVNFFGFPKLMCPTCQREGTLPLSSARWTTYAVIAALAVVFTAINIANGGLPVVGVIPALMIAALVMNHGVAQKHQAACARWEQIKRQPPAAGPGAGPAGSNPSPGA